MSDFRRAIEVAKDIYRQIHSGGCKLLSQGDKCRCFLCRVEAAVVDEEERQRQNAYAEAVE